jgi:hypothetical protein
MAQWYYAHDQQQLGPVSWEKLRQLASSGGLDKTDLVWREGMPQWQKATTVEGLFAKSAVFAAAGASAASASAVSASGRRVEPSRRSDAERSSPERPRSEQVVSAERVSAERVSGERAAGRSSADRDPDDDAPRRRKRRKKEEGMSPGAMAGLIGGCIAGGLVIVIIVIVLLVRTGNRGVANQPPPLPVAVGDNAGGGVDAAAVAFQPTSYEITLGQGQQNLRSFQFQQGQRVTINVNTKGGFIQRPDVDLEVTRGGDAGFMMSDYSLSEHCFVNFIAPATDQYTLRVDNLGPGGASCTVNIR